MVQTQGGRKRIGTLSTLVLRPADPSHGSIDEDHDLQVAVTAPSGLMTSVAMRLQDGGGGGGKELTGSVCWAEVGRYEVRALLEQEWAANSGMQVFAIPLQDGVSTANSAQDANDGVLRLTANDSKSLANNRLSFSLSSQRHAPAGVNSAANPNPGFVTDPIGVGVPVVSTPRQRRPSAALSAAPSLALAALGAGGSAPSTLVHGVTADAHPAPASRLVTTTASAPGGAAGLMPQLNLSSASAASANATTNTTTPSAQQLPVMPKLDLSAITAAAHEGGPKQVLSLSSLSGLTAGGLSRRYGTGSVVSSRMSDVSSLPGGSPRTARSGRHSHRYTQVRAVWPERNARSHGAARRGTRQNPDEWVVLLSLLIRDGDGRGFRPCVVQRTPRGATIREDAPVEELSAPPLAQRGGPLFKQASFAQFMLHTHPAPETSYAPSVTTRCGHVHCVSSLFSENRFNRAKPM